MPLAVGRADEAASSARSNEGRSGCREFLSASVRDRAQQRQQRISRGRWITSRARLRALARRCVVGFREIRIGHGGHGDQEGSVRLTMQCWRYRTHPLRPRRGPPALQIPPYRLSLRGPPRGGPVIARLQRVRGGDLRRAGRSLVVIQRSRHIHVRIACCRPSEKNGEVGFKIPALITDSSHRAMGACLHCPCQPCRRCTHVCSFQTPGRRGLQAVLPTLASMGCHPLSVVTALTGRIRGSRGLMAV